MEKIDQNALNHFLKNNINWSFTDNAISREIRVKDFKTAFSIMTAIAFEAEALGHHPEWSNVYNTIKIRLTTHDAGNAVTQKDVKLAEQIEVILAVFE